MQGNLGKRRNLIGLMAVMTIPFICSAILLISQKTRFNGLSIVCSEWNDELFYYKQVEAMVDFGHPLGYWGYNEGHSLYGNFAAWNPVNYIIYAITGKLFGWGYITPVIVNLVIWTVTFGLIHIFLKPRAKQWIGIIAAFLALSINIRYIFSCTPESTAAAGLIILCIMIVKYDETGKIGFFVAANLLLMYLVAMRGYYAAFVLIMMAVIIKKKKWLLLVLQTIIILLDLIIFVLLCKYFAATYFLDTFHFDNLKSPRAFAGAVRWGMTETAGFMKEALKGGSMRGTWYIVFFILCICELIVFLRKRNLVNLSVIIVSGGILMAMWSVYNAQEGARNLMACETALIIMTVYYMDSLFLGVATAVITGIVCWSSHDVFYTALPKTDPAIISAVENSDLKSVMPLSDNVWDNTVVWPLYTQFNGLYAIPSGFGINCVRDEYVFDNYDELRSKYIVAEQGSDMDAFISKKNAYHVSNVGKLNIYALR